VVIPQDNAELKTQVRSVEKLRAEAEQALAAADKAHSEEANRLRRISKKTAEDLEDAQLQLKAAQERLSTVELQWQQASQELAVATAQLDALQSQGFKADSAISENARLKQVCVLYFFQGAVGVVELARSTLQNTFEQYLQCARFWLWFKAPFVRFGSSRAAGCGCVSPG
jgi:DNA repair exonuclease SbcCD ATPase subunit